MCGCELKGHHRAAVAGLPAVHVIAREVLESGVVDPCDVRACLEELRDLLGVLHVAVQAHREGLDAADEQEGVERPQHAARGVLDEGDAVAKILAAGHDEARDQIGVAS